MVAHAASATETSTSEPRAAFQAFPSIKIAGMSREEFGGRLLLEEKVAVFPGSAFGQYGERCIPRCYAPSLSKIEEAPKRMGRFIDRHCQKTIIGYSYL